jgi:hypothetical protein
MSVLKTKCGKVHLLIKDYSSNNLEVWNDNKISAELKFLELMVDEVAIDLDAAIAETKLFFSNFGPHGPVANGFMYVACF